MTEVVAYLVAVAIDYIPLTSDGFALDEPREVFQVKSRRHLNEIVYTLKWGDLSSWLSFMSHTMSSGDSRAGDFILPDCMRYH